MKADLYVQGNYWATIDVPGDGLLALLAQGMITQAKQKAAQLQRELNDLDGVVCSISLRLQAPTTYPPGTGDPNNPSQKENTDAHQSALPLVHPDPTPHS